MYIYIYIYTHLYIHIYNISVRFFWGKLGCSHPHKKKCLLDLKTYIGCLSAKGSTTREKQNITGLLGEEVDIPLPVTFQPDMNFMFQL